MLWCQKYGPRNLEEFAGNGEVVEELRKWASDWNRGIRGKPLLLHGPPGVGKSALAYALAGSMEWGVIETNASDLRDAESINRVAGAASSSMGLNGERKLVLIDEVDGLLPGDKGGGRAILDIINSSMQPTILIANDVWSQSLGSIRSACRVFEMKRINSRTIASILWRIAEKEGVAAAREIVDKIAKDNDGDLRSAINDLQALGEGRSALGEVDAAYGRRDREKNVFDSLRSLMKAATYKDATSVLWNLDIDRGLFTRWIEENIPNEYEKREEIADAFEMLSRADVFSGRIMRRQYWGFLRYVNDLTTAGVALAKRGPYHKFVRYEYPRIIRKLGASKGEREKRRAIGRKIGAKCHVSAKDAAAIFLPLVRQLCGDAGNVAKIKDYFGFDDEELAFIMGTSEKGVEKVLNGPKKKRRKA